MINSKDFSFSKKEVEILFLIKYLALKETIKEYKHGHYHLWYLKKLKEEKDKVIARKMVERVE